MLIHKVGALGFQHEYGIHCCRLHSNAPGSSTPFGSSWCVVEPGGQTEPHHHPDEEVFFIMRGRGRMVINGEEAPVSQGDVIHIPSQSNHYLRNFTEQEPLVFLSIWWGREGAQEVMPSGSPAPRVWVLSAPPTPNGNLHLGHLAGPYLAADLFRRHLRQRGGDPRYSSGSDDHQSYVAFKALGERGSGTDVADRFATSIEGTLRAINAAPDDFLRPLHAEEYKRFVQDFFLKLHSEGNLLARPCSVPYCDHCQLHLFEAYIGGKCPHCGDGTNGNGCEACGVINDCTDLREPTCNLCHRSVSSRRLTRLYFPLEGYRERISRWLDTVKMNSRLRAFTRGLLEKPLMDVGVSHVASWGIPVPVPGLEGQVFSAWAEMAAGYVHSASQCAPQGDWRALWKAPEAQVALFFGFDNAFFYTALIPALLMAWDADIRPPAALVCNEFYRLEGRKFSTSRRHAIWGDELLASVPADIIRLYLAYDRPEVEQTSFSLEDFLRFVQHELVDGWEGWLIALDEKLEGSFGRGVPMTKDFTPEQLRFHEQLRVLTREVAAACGLEAFSPGRVARVLCELVWQARRFAASQIFLREVPTLGQQWANAVCLELTALKTLALLAAPVLPASSRALLRKLGLSEKADWDESVSLLPAGLRIQPLGTDEFSRAATAIKAFASSRGHPVH
jgi:methionyl-tRNA synthetase